MSGIRLVLRHRVSGKIASRKDQGSKALILEAQRFTNKGLGGGIASLLVPSTTKEKNDLAKIRAIYKVSRVKTRPGKKSGTSDRKALSKFFSNDDLICKLVVEFAGFFQNKRYPHARSIKAFTVWLERELTKTKSRVFELVSERAPVLLEVKRSERWWADAFAQRKKRRV